MRASIATVCLAGTLEQKLAACAAAGLDGVEIFEQDLITSPLTPEEVRARAERLGLCLDLYQPFRDLEGVPEEQFVQNLRRLEAKFQLMDRLGIDTILVCSNVSTATVNDDAIMVSQLRRAGELAERYGKRIAYEALAWGKYVNTYWHSWEIARAANHAAVGVCLDSFHILSLGDDPNRIAEIPSERIFFVQLADAQDLGMEVLPWSRHFRVFPGEGDFDLVGFVTQLLRAGYTGPLSLEIFNDVFREADPVPTAIDGARSLRWLQQRVRGVRELGEDRLAQLSAVAKIDPVERLDHVEITSDEPDAVGAVLSTLGFNLIGRHRRKLSLLFRAGDTRVVLTPQPDGGTRVASVAVAVADAEVAVRRAESLGAHRTPRPVTADEAALPGVGCGPWQLFFVDEQLAAWTSEFGDDASSFTRTDDALTIDHLNLTESREHFDATVLFLESVLRMHRIAPLDVASHRGLVRSQVLESPEAEMRWVLNLVPEALRPAQYPMHLAFRVHDAVAVARRSQAAGLTPLPVSTNYYEDLAARFEIPADTLAQWQRLGVLYDRDASGEFIHFYTRTVGGLFFEVVQRLDGYAGYGAADAPVRLAAQAIGTGV